VSHAGRVVACALAAAAALSGCFLFEEAGCATDGDCDEGQLCRDAVCLARCDVLGGAAEGCAECGDGVVAGDEACDDGSSANSDTTPDACRQDCTEARCGDGVRDAAEDCDDAVGNSDEVPDACRSDCRAAHCGDGVLDRGEACDPALPEALPGSCRQDCTIARCGDGQRDEGEACDEGVENGRDGALCTATCALSPTCGDGVLDPGESCDPGVQDGPACGPGCRPAGCGDGVIGPGEQCDDGGGEALSDCAPDCRLACGVWRQIAAARGYTLALRADGRLFGAGWNDEGELGIGDHDKRYGSPRELAEHRFARIAARDRHALGLTRVGRVYGWGDGLSGATGAGVGSENVVAPRLLDLEGRRAIGIEAGDGVSIVELEDHTFLLFGEDAHGELGDGVSGVSVSRPRALEIAGLAKVASTGGHTVGLTEDGTVWVWGGNAFGQLGVPAAEAPFAPFQATLPPEAGRIRDVACGETSIVLLDEDGQLFGAGGGGEGNLGDGDFVAHDAFTRIFTATPEPVLFDRLSVGGWSTFALRDGAIWASGANRLGQLGLGVAGEDVAVPGRVALPQGRTVVQLSAGHSHSVLLADDGALYGFGQLQHGALGLGLAEPSSDVFEAAPIELPLWPRCVAPPTP
jgi:alpha-tubulin suppressor-like RCC1 family protein